VAETPDTAAPLPDHDDEHAKNARVRRNLLLLSLANWALAILTWTISAYLGITSPASIMVYTVLFVIGLAAVAVAVVAYLLERFAHRPEPPSAEVVDGDAPDTVPTSPA
jgi:hypothetical protein